MICNDSGKPLPDSMAASALNKYFGSCFSFAPHSEKLKNNKGQDCFSEEEYKKALFSLNPNSAPGPDDIPMFFWIKTYKAISRFILKLFNTFLEETYAPPIWKIAKIFPLYKNNGKIHNVESYRPISLTCCLSKIFEKMILNRMTEQISNEDILFSNQHGFRNKFSSLEFTGNL